jgi:hypothetical protein
LPGRAGTERYRNQVQDVAGEVQASVPRGRQHISPSSRAASPFFRKHLASLLFAGQNGQEGRRRWLAGLD